MHPAHPHRRSFGLLGAVLVCSLAVLHAQDPRCEHGFPGLKLKQRHTRGQAIPSALGSRLAEVAKAYGRTEAELRAMCNRDRNSLHVDADARLVYLCRALPLFQQAAAAPGNDAITQPSYPLSETFFLSSNLNASKTIYLDFTGHTTSGTVWNNSITGGVDIVTPPYDTDGNPSSFSNTELANIQSIWKRVAEDFAPFNVNVTTKEPPVDELRRSNSSDIFYGLRVVIGGNSNWLGGGAGGVAYLGSFRWSSDTPAFVFPKELGNGNAKYVAEAASHEAGHGFGLNHDGTSSVEYYEGHSNWAPIMGVGYYRAVTQWSKGEYNGANNKEDDIAIIAQEVSYRTDSQGNTPATAVALTGPTLFAEGIVGSRTDVDYFKVTTGTGTASFTVTPDNTSPNLDVQLRLFNSAGALLATANPTTLNTTLTASLTQGIYYLEVDGVGSGAATTGYNDYGSLGQYRVTGNVSTASGQPPVAVADNSAPLTGMAPHAVTFSSAGSNDSDGFITSYLWNFGNGATAPGQTASYTYTTPGTYTATLTVTDNSGLSGSDSVTVVVGAPPPPVTKVVSVGDIGMNVYLHRRTYYYATAAVIIRDQDGKPVPNATVKGTWSGLARGTYSGRTNKNGLITFSSPSTRYLGMFAFSVVAVGAKGYVYDPAKNSETSDWIATP